MADIVIHPKYKIRFWLILALLLIIAVSVLAAGIVTLQASPLSAEEAGIMTRVTVSYFVMFVLTALCFLNLPVRKIVIGSGGMTVSTFLGVIRRRPFAPNAYYEQGCLIINGFLISSSFYKNTGELDSALKKLSAEGKIKYKREKGVLASQPAGYSIILSVSICILGILFGISLGMLPTWVYLIVIDAVFLVWLILTFNKLPRVNKSISKQLSVYFE